MSKLKNPAARPGFALRGTKSDEMLDSIFCDDRHRTAQVELVAEADLNLVLVDFTVPVKVFAPVRNPKLFSLMLPQFV